ncbi:hypothetical protein [Pseudonocardia sp. ICBG601]|uniref:hypothetical protein n=1 Tax=Pseudonocardia sp. ICBG601 TaxID=2846759 RepID=UPI001CF61488|nr:hypothetical protein [Pseudonocardia sp. ICBG601]
MGHAALGVCTHPPVGGTFLPDSPDSDPDPGVDQGFSWCPDGLTEQVIDRLYGNLLHDLEEQAEPSGEPDDTSGSARLLTFPTRQPVAVSAGQWVVSGGEVA